MTGAGVTGAGAVAVSDAGPGAYYQPSRAVDLLSVAGLDSDLEAFSHYPTDGSVAALSCRAAAKTNYLNQRFLSY